MQQNIMNNVMTDSDNSYRSPLSVMLAKVYKQLMHKISGVSYAQRTLPLIEGTGGTVSVADILAYQIGWGKLLVSWYQSGMTGELPLMPGEGFTSWNYTKIAQHFYQKHHYDAGKQQEKEFESIVHEILKIIEKEDAAGNLDKIGIWDWCTLSSGKQWPLSKWIHINTIAPYKRAYTQVNRVISMLNKG